MKNEEFKKEFKVGDLITCSTWLSLAPEEEDSFGKIAVISDEEFCLKDRDGLTVCLISQEDWQHYKEPVKKDLEGLTEYYYIVKSSSKTKVLDCGSIGFWLHKPTMKTVTAKYASGYYNNENADFITEQEAKERGLKI